MKRTQLELGGKNALIICPDADLDAAIEGAVKGMNLGWTAGQSCGSTSRILAHSSVHDAVVAGIETAFSAVRLGDPLSQDTEMGSLSTASQFQRVTDYIASAKQQGAAIRGGAEPQSDARSADKAGFFVKPTLLVDVTPDMTVAREEVFGPVLSVTTFEDEAEAVALANGTDYGLAAAIFTRDLSRAHRMVRDIKAGVVHVNCYGGPDITVPLSGMKQSGNGSDKSLHALDKFTDLKTAWIAL